VGNQILSAETEGMQRAVWPAAAAAIREAGLCLR